MQDHVHQPCHHKLVRNILTSQYAFRILNIGIEVVGHQHIVPVRSSPNVRRNVLYGRGVSGGNMAPHDMPPPAPHHPPKADDVWAVESEIFDRKLLHLAIKNRDAAAVNARRLFCHQPKAARSSRVKYFCDLHFLEKSQSTRPCAIPRSADSRPLFQPFWMLNFPKLAMFSVSHLNPLFSLVHTSVGTQIPYHQKCFLCLYLPDHCPCPLAGIPST